MKRAIIFDCDDTVLNYTKGFSTWMSTRRNIQPVSDPNHGIDLAFGPILGGRPGVEQAVREFNKSPYFAHLEAMPGAIEALRRIKGRHQDCDMTLLTCCGVDRQTIASRIANLDKHGIGWLFDHIIMQPLYTKKAGALREFGQFVLIDDNPKYLAEAEMDGGSALRMIWPHNEHLATAGFYDWDVADDFIAMALADIDSKVPVPAIAA